MSHESELLRPFASEIHQFIRETHTYAELSQVMLFELDERLDLIASPNDGFDKVVFDVVLWADRSGHLLDLTVAVSAAKPNRPEGDQLLRRMRAALDTTASQGTVSIPDVSADGSQADALPAGLLAFVRAYERIRVVMPESPERTVVMEQMVTKLRGLPLVGGNIPSRFHLSPASGERLAAIVALRLEPDPRFLRWLSERLAVEYAFAGYHAAVALRESATLLPVDYLDRVFVATQDARDLLNDERASGRLNMLDEVLSVVRQRTAHARDG